MSHAAVFGQASFVNPVQPVVHQQKPLSFLKTGDHARISKVRGKGDVHHHLENLGFVTGEEVSIVSEQGGNLIIQVKNTQVALDSSIASKIMVG